MALHQRQRGHGISEPQIPRCVWPGCLQVCVSVLSLLRLAKLLGRDDNFQCALSLFFPLLYPPTSHARSFDDSDELMNTSQISWLSSMS